MRLEGQPPAVRIGQPEAAPPVVLFDPDLRHGLAAALFEDDWFLDQDFDL
jgi:hypothetical protein